MSRPIPELTRATRERGLVVVTITGELDKAGTLVIEPAFDAAVPDRRTRVVVNLADVPFLTSAALAMFVVRAQAHSHHGGKLYLAGANRLVSHVFEQAGFHAIFPIYPTLDEAIAHVEQEMTGDAADG